MKYDFDKIIDRSGSGDLKPRCSRHVMDATT